MADKLQRLRNISSKVPIMNEQAAARIAGGRALQLQQAAQAAQPGAGVRQAQQVAPQIAAQSGAQQLQQQAQQQQQDVGLAQQAISTQSQQAQQDLASRSLAQKEELGGQALQQQTALSREAESSKKTLTQEEIDSAKRMSQLGMETDNTVSFMSRKQREDLASLGADVKQQLFDSRMQFERDENGRKFSNDRQMADYAISSAKNEQELQDRMQSMMQVHERELFALEAANKQLGQALQNGFLDKDRELNQAQKKKLTEMKTATEKALAKKRRASANKRLIIGGAMTVAGAAMIATGVGAAPGAAVMGTGASYATSGGQ